MTVKIKTQKIINKKTQKRKNNNNKNSLPPNKN